MRGVAQGAATEERAALPVSDAVLLAHARHDRAAFAPLYDRYFEPIFRFCFYRLGDWQEAEDAAGDIFAKALGGLGRVRIDDREDGFRCWLFTIARHVIANRHRDRARRPARPLEMTAELVDESPGPEEAALTVDQHRYLHALLGQLKPDQRDLLELRLAGLNDAQIARVLGRSHDAVRKEQSRTIRTLRGLVNDQMEGGRADA